MSETNDTLDNTYIIFYNYYLLILQIFYLSIFFLYWKCTLRLPAIITIDLLKIWELIN